jgi:hypothetical protein
LLIFKGTLLNTLGTIAAALSIYKDGVKIASGGVSTNVPASNFAPITLSVLDGPMVGDQTPDYDVRVRTATNTLQIYSGGPNSVDAGAFTALEVGRP